MLLSTLRRFVTEMGGNLSLIAEFPDRDPGILAGLASHDAETAGLHYGPMSADALAAELGRAHGVRTAAVQADLADAQAAAALVDRAADALGAIDFLVNSASIFEPLDFGATDLADWQRHLAVNLTAPFLISQSFARRLGSRPGAIVNLLDWRALRPEPDHFAYTISKAGLAAMTTSLAQALAPSIRANGLALGAILPPADGNKDPNILKNVPSQEMGKQK